LPLLPLAIGGIIMALSDRLFIERMEVVMKRINAMGIDVVVYEAVIEEGEFPF
jgi:hypothetical protein